jgi:hypothetical protein
MKLLKSSNPHILKFQHSPLPSLPSILAAAVGAGIVAADVVLAAAARLAGRDRHCRGQDERKNKKGGAKQTGHDEPPSTIG